VSYRDVTLSPDDIEWVREWPDPDGLKALVWDDAGFAGYVEQHGLPEALERVTAFHRTIANQLIVRGVTERRQSDWTRRAVDLCRAVKRRRGQLRGRYQTEHGSAAFVEFDRLDEKYPRAEWGGLTKGNAP
jgi:hypothetical protein